MHQLLKFILFWNNTLHVSVFPSIVRSSRLYIQVYVKQILVYLFDIYLLRMSIIRRSVLYIQQQVYVKRILLSAWHIPVAVCTVFNF